MEKTTKQVKVSISQTEEGIVIKNNLGLEWKFTYTMTTFDALVLMISRTMRVQFDKQSAFRDKFTIEMTIK